MALTMNQINIEPNKAFTASEICPLRWYLVKVERFGQSNQKYHYFILHIADLIECDGRTVCISRPVQFLLNNIIVDGIVLQGSNRILNLLQHIKEITHNDSEISQSTQKLLYRFTQSLRELYRWAGSLMQVQYKSAVDMRERMQYLQQVKQLSLDADELLEVKGFFYSLNEVCAESWAIIEQNKTMSFDELKEQLLDYMAEANAVAAEVVDIQRTFHPAHCICNIFDTPEFDDILQQCAKCDANNSNDETLDR